MTEQRKYHRVPVDLSVTCLLGEEEFDGLVKDLSVGGMFIECDTQPPFATKLILLIDGISARELRIPAVVRWVEPEGFGVQFGLLGGYATHAIVDLVKKRS